MGFSEGISGRGGGKFRTRCHRYWYNGSPMINYSSEPITMRYFTDKYRTRRCDNVGRSDVDRQVYAKLCERCTVIKQHKATLTALIMQF